MRQQPRQRAVQRHLGHPLAAHLRAAAPGDTWNATGGGDGSVTSQNQYLGLQKVKVPAFPEGILAAAVRSQIALAGTPGDDYGSGTRTTWWGCGVGPVKVVFDHVDGSVTTAQLTSTNLPAQQPPADQNYFPMNVGFYGTYEWTNPQHLSQPEIEKVSVAAALNARLVSRSRACPVPSGRRATMSCHCDSMGCATPMAPPPAPPWRSCPSSATACTSSRPSIS